MSTTEETIEEAFSKFGEVERVKKIKDYCFIHFRTREQAREALEDMNGNKYFTFERYRSLYGQVVNGSMSCKVIHECIPCKLDDLYPQVLGDSA